MMPFQMEGIEFIQDLAVIMLCAGGFGWAAKRCGLSAVVGYLVAGIVVGPYTPPFSLVSNTDRIQTISQLGLVFVMFSIGMGLSIKRLQRMGAPLLIGTALAAVINFFGSRLLGATLGFNETESLFLAGMLMVSSSAIISKVLQEQDAVHLRPGQMALGVTVLEDVVAVIMLTMLGSFARVGSTSVAVIGHTVGALALFVLLLAFTSMLLVPKIMDRLNRAGSPEVQTTITVGLVLGLAWLGVKAGYSPALGAFLLGAIVSETPQRPQVERMFEGLREMFSAMFFVAIGMLIQVHYFGEIWLPMVVIAVATLLGRTLAATFSFLVTGHQLRDSIRAGMTVTPIGEFSFIIAQMGIAAMVLPAKFYPLAAGVALVTAFAAPLMVKLGPGVARRCEKWAPKPLLDALDLYHRGLDGFREAQNANLLWTLTRGRIVQVVMTLALVMAVLYYSETLYKMASQELSERGYEPVLLPFIFWSVLGAVVLAPLVAVWRNISALAMIFTEGILRSHARSTTQARILETLIKVVCLIAVVFLLSNFLPIGSGRAALPVAAGSVVLCSLLVALFWKRLVLWHSRVEIAVKEVLSNAPSATPGAPETSWLQKHDEWEVNVGEIVLPDNARAAGRSLGGLGLRSRFSISVVGVDRQGFVLANPGPETVLYPLDRILMIGDPESIKKCEAELSQVRRSDELAAGFDEIEMEVIEVDPASPRAGRSLFELQIPAMLGVQLAGIRRDGKVMLSPGGEEKILAGDELLVLGANNQIVDFIRWMMTGDQGAWVHRHPGMSAETPPA